ncbi:NAD(P)-binding domain-containing protein [Stackebrandtia albiflava]|uniref:NAD(P)-binding domain-containing protein n=1 Tax=Stackebrandtia albiflava TaxID=406432 RepID=UPI0011BF990D|nr:NAD(P)-binding domain-containing protein [Stackebrandtia albiflava]
MNRDVDVVVVGAGQAGLSAAYFLRKAGLVPDEDFVVLDRYNGPGGAWRHRWPSLTFTTVHGIHQLPGMAVPEPDPAESVAPVVSAYFGEYERRFALPVHRPVDVREVRDLPDGRLVVTTDDGEWRTRALVNATGTWEKPFWPYYPGQERFSGRQLHTADYRDREEFRDRRVLVVGGGASGIQLLMEIAEVASRTYWVTRREPVFVDRPFDRDWGREVVARVADRVSRGLPPESVVKATGYRLTPQIEAARRDGPLRRLPMFDRIEPTGVRWRDGRFAEVDVILWATGFRAALDHLAPLRLRGPGGGIVMDGTRVAADPRIHLVGYGPSASTIGANRAGRDAVRELRRFLARRPQPVAA